ncbi:MAG: NAD(P)-binding domain-containing protein, partial [Leptospira sp.]|nr:NAD(P)-binding domain-containing protein [Leptospira sp.]
NVNRLIESSRSLKIISRVGIGLDSVPLSLCKQKKIAVCYTPDAVTHAVSELTIGLMLDVSRHVTSADREIRKGIWSRKLGKRLKESVIGLVGFGRIGFSVSLLLGEFHPQEILVYDIKNKTQEIEKIKQKFNIQIRQTSLEEILQYADIVSLHVPFSGKTKNLINLSNLSKMRESAFIINTARGGIVNEADLYEALSKKMIQGAAIDVFEEEPYKGNLLELENVLLTQHMGSCSFDCRSQMELQATEDVVRFFKNEPLKNEVPSEEYEYQLE